MNYLASVASLTFPPGTLICNKNHALAIKFTNDLAVRTHNNWLNLFILIYLDILLIFIIQLIKVIPVDRSNYMEVFSVNYKLE